MLAYKHRMKEMAQKKEKKQEVVKKTKGEVQSSNGEESRITATALLYARSSL